MSPRIVVGTIAIAYLIALLIFDVTAWPLLAVGAALWLAFFAVDAIQERRDQADRQQVARICDRQETTR